MCSVFGFVRSASGGKPDAAVLRRIVAANIHRGPHAYGFAWIDGEGRLKCFKQAGDLTKQFGFLAMAAKEAEILIGHLRWATHGSPKEAINNHPHPADGGWIVHNGIVSNYRDLVVKRQLLPVSECDSEVIGQMIEREEGTLVERCIASANACEGPLTMLGLWSRPATVVVARRGNPIHFSKTNDGCYFGSLAAGLPIGECEFSDDRLWMVRYGKKVEMKLYPLEPSSGPCVPAYAGRAYRGG